MRRRGVARAKEGDGEGTASARRDFLREAEGRERRRSAGVGRGRSGRRRDCQRRPPRRRRGRKNKRNTTGGGAGRRRVAARAKKNKGWGRGGGRLGNRIWLALVPGAAGVPPLPLARGAGSWRGAEVALPVTRRRRCRPPRRAARRARAGRPRARAMAAAAYRYLACTVRAVAGRASASARSLARSSAPLCAARPLARPPSAARFFSNASPRRPCVALALLVAFRPPIPAPSSPLPLHPRPRRLLITGRRRLNSIGLDDVNDETLAVSRRLRLAAAVSFVVAPSPVLAIASQPP